MDLTWFKSTVVAPDMHGNVLIAFFDGNAGDRAQQAGLVTMLICRTESAIALNLALTAALKEK